MGLALLFSWLFRIGPVFPEFLDTTVQVEETDWEEDDDEVLPPRG